MNLDVIKEKLLSTGEFEDNIYLYKYCELIITQSYDSYIANKMNKHHIIPRSYYVYNNIDIDNSEDNIAILLFKDHILAHYLLYKCSTSIQKYCNAHAVIHLVNQKHLTLKNLSEMFCFISLDDCQKLYENFKLGLHDVLSEKCGGLSNGNCKYDDYKALEEVKYLLNNDDLSYKDISTITDLPEYLIQSISRGVHWCCKKDNFVSNRVLKYRTNHIDNVQKKEKKLQKKKELYDLKKQKILLEEKEYKEWLSQPRFCKQCGKLMTEYYISKKYGKGIFCSSSCVYSYVASKRNTDYYKKASSNRRSFSGKNNPNYGKKASKETREKISKALKNSVGVKNSKRFTGKKHTEQSKKKISETLKKRYEKQ